MNIKLLGLTQSLADRTGSVSDILVIIAHTGQRDRTHNEICCLFLDEGGGHLVLFQPLEYNTVKHSRLHGKSPFSCFKQHMFISWLCMSYEYGHCLTVSPRLGLYKTAVKVLAGLQPCLETRNKSTLDSLRSWCRHRFSSFQLQDSGHFNNQNCS